LRLRRFAAAADGGRYSHADGPHVVGALRRNDAQGPARGAMVSDNGPQYTATATVLYAHELGLVPITTPAYSPESQRPGRGVHRDLQARLRDRRRVAGCRNRPGPARRLDQRLQHPGAAFRARDAEPSRIPGRAAHAQLLAVSRTLGSTPEIAKALGLNISVVKTRVHRAGCSCKRLG